jgi:hypothetical protein
MKMQIAVGTDLGHIDNVVVTWADFRKALTRHKVATAKGGKYFVGGYFNGHERREANMVSRTVLTFDVDAPTMPLDEMELALEMHLGCGLVAYSTYNHTADEPRIRIVIPLSRAVTPAEHGPLAKAVGDELGIPLDACSFKANQAMYLPTCPDVSKAWALDVDGEPLQVGDYLSNVVSISGPRRDTGDDLEAALAAQPLDIDMATIHEYLRACTPAMLTYDEWVRVGAALHHQFQGGAEGLDLWHYWSAEDAERYDSATIETKWRSFGKGSRMVTFASVIHMVKDRGGLGTVTTTDDTGATPFDVLLQEAAAVSDRSGYQALADRVKAMPSNLLADVDRSMLVEALHKGWPKSVGIGKVDVRKSLTPAKRSSGSGELGFAKDWVYVEVPCEFRNIELNYAIKREAFNTKFANEPVVLLDGRQASVLVSESPDFVSVVDTMYWPGAQTLFDYAGRTMLNSYRDTRVLPSATLDTRGQAAVDLFLSHAAIILPDQVERNIMLDWLAYVVQNPGKRINWAIFLQGIAGAGKTYFPGVVRDILGEGNTNEVTVDALVSSFTGYAEGSILAIVEELRLSGESKYMIIDKLKPFITNDVISVVTKGKDARTVPNFTSYFMLSNFKDAIPVDDTDRRYCVLYSAIQTEADLMDAFGDKDAKDAYFTALFDSKDDNLEALAHYLLTRKLGAGFKPKGSAPMTNAKMEMRDLAVTDDTTLVIDAISEHACGIIGEHIVDVTYLAKLAMLDGDEFPQTTRVKKIMMELGYSYCGGNNRPNIPHKTGSAKRSRHSVWFKKPETVLTANAKVIEFHTDPDYVPF